MLLKNKFFSVLFLVLSIAPLGKGIYAYELRNITDDERSFYSEGNLSSADVVITILQDQRVRDRISTLGTPMEIEGREKVYSHLSFTGEVVLTPFLFGDPIYSIGFDRNETSYTTSDETIFNPRLQRCSVLVYFDLHRQAVNFISNDVECH